MYMETRMLPTLTLTHLERWPTVSKKETKLRAVLLRSRRRVADYETMMSLM